MRWRRQWAFVCLPRTVDRRAYLLRLPRYSACSVDMKRQFQNAQLPEEQNRTCGMRQSPLHQPSSTPLPMVPPSATRLIVPCSPAPSPPTISRPRRLFCRCHLQKANGLVPWPAQTITPPACPDLESVTHPWLSSERTTTRPWLDLRATMPIIPARPSMRCNGGIGASQAAGWARMHLVSILLLLWS